ncbi:hypothetical protein H8E88_02900 [candidate division KSB1 bacterium]|nr:hypothetical protein [candidate division KSB1 bacterium]
MRRKVWKARWDSPTWITRNWLRVASYRDYQFDNLSNDAQRSIFLAAGQAVRAINNPVNDRGRFFVEGKGHYNKN